jgi:hypothetical protein
VLPGHQLTGPSEEEEEEEELCIANETYIYIEWKIILCYYIMKERDLISKKSCCLLKLFINRVGDERVREERG